MTLAGFFGGHSFHLVQQSLGGVSALLMTGQVASLLIAWRRRRRF